MILLFLPCLLDLLILYYSIHIDANQSLVISLFYASFTYPPLEEKTKKLLTLAHKYSRYRNAFIRWTCDGFSVYQRCQKNKLDFRSGLWVFWMAHSLLWITFFYIIAFMDPLLFSGTDLYSIWWDLYS